jgi:DnaJ-class molecular chaperone
MVIDFENLCKKCKGERICEVEKEIEVPLERGIPDNYPYQLTG